MFACWLQLSVVEISDVFAADELCSENLLCGCFLYGSPLVTKFSKFKFELSCLFLQKQTFLVLVIYTYKLQDTMINNWWEKCSLMFFYFPETFDFVSTPNPVSLTKCFFCSYEVKWRETYWVIRAIILWCNSLMIKIWFGALILSIMHVSCCRRQKTFQQRFHLICKQIGLN